MSSPRGKANYCGVSVRMFVIVAVVATLCYPALVDAAAMARTEDSPDLPRVMWHRLGNVRVLRAAGASDEDTSNRNCHNAPCGWAVYDRRTRSVEYFMRNTCRCTDKNYKCVRYDDNLSASAYVYRCRQNVTANDLELPADAGNH